MTDLDVRGDLSMAGKAEFRTVELGFAHVGGTLDLTGSSVAEVLDMVGIQVDQGLIMEDAKFTQINLATARVSWLLLDCSRITGLLDMGFLRVDNNLVMTQAEFAEVSLGPAHVQGHLVLAKSKVAGDLTMLGPRVDGIDNHPASLESECAVRIRAMGIKAAAMIAI